MFVQNLLSIGLGDKETLPGHLRRTMDVPQCVWKTARRAAHSAGRGRLFRQKSNLQRACVVVGCLLPLLRVLALRNPRCVSSLFWCISARQIVFSMPAKVMSQNPKPARERHGTHHLYDALISVSPGRKRMRALATRHRRRNSSGRMGAYLVDLRIVRVSHCGSLLLRHLSHGLCGRCSPPVATERACNTQICYLQH